MFKKIRARLFLIATLGLLWLWIRRPRPEGEGKTSPAEITVETAEIVIPTEDAPPTDKVEAISTVQEAQPADSLGDNLTAITGIGPKIAAVLQTAGITRFTQLAKADPTQLRQILESARIRLAKPENWIEQAKTLLKE